MISIKINNIEFFVKKNISVLEACRYVGIFIPRFCYHEKLSVAGNCRMCLVDSGIKLVSSCTAVVDDNPQIFTDTPMVKKARENVIESLLLNHPLDCPICDQAGECDLQDQTKMFGGDYSRFFMSKRGVEDKECGPLIKTIMTRCIHCTRCVRYGTEVAGVDYFGTLNRGGSTEIGNFIPKLFNSEVSGNVIDLCPVGALTSKPYAFKARPWELRITESIDLSDSLGSNTYLNFKETEIVRVLPKNNINLNENWISDKARFSYDALKTQRLQQPLIKKNDKIHNLNWSDVLKNLLDAVKNSKTCVLIDDDLDLTSINILKNLQRKYPNTVKLRTLATQNNVTNFETNILDNKLKDLNETVETAFVISSNIRLESAILNTRLRSKFLNETFNIVTAGLKPNNNIPSNIINLNINNILNIFEGKAKGFSNLIINAEKPLFIFGESFKHRYNNMNSIKNLLRTLAPTSIMLFIGSKSNTRGHEIVNGILPLNSNDIKSSDSLLCVNLEDNLKVRKLLNSFSGQNFWINTHYSDVLLKIDSCIIVPALSFYEDENLFINLEGKPQKTLKGINGPKMARSIRKLFSTLLETKVSSKIYSHLREILNTGKSTTNLGSLFTLANLNVSITTAYSNYPFKATVEDFYRTNNLLKNSPVMAECSNEVRKISTNF